MADNEQLSLEAEQAVPRQGEPDAAPLDLRDPTLTKEQDERYDMLVDTCGFTRAEAHRAVGAGPVRHEVHADEPESEAKPTPTQVGHVIVTRDGLPEHARFGMWDNEH